jgi:hypothetical protein
MRKLSVLVAHLPPESALTAALRLEYNALSDDERSEIERNADEHDVESEQWSRIEQLLAAVRDELHFLRFSYDSAHSKSRPKWKAEQLPRPGVKPKRKERRPLNDTQVEALWSHLQGQLDS